MQRLLQMLSRPFVLFITTLQKGRFKKFSSQFKENHTNAKFLLGADDNNAIINAWYAPSTSEQIYYYASDSFNSTPMTFPNTPTSKN